MSYLNRTRQKDPKGQNIIIYQGSGSPCAAGIRPKHRGDLYIDTTTPSMYISLVYFTSTGGVATMWGRTGILPYKA